MDSAQDSNLATFWGDGKSLRLTEIHTSFFTNSHNSDYRPRAIISRS